MTLDEFNARVAVEPSYPEIIHLQKLRILVILPSFQDGYGREHADVVGFIYQGQMDILFNRFGPPKKSINLQRITIYDLLKECNDRGSSCTVPFEFTRGGCNDCGYPWICDFCHKSDGQRICRDCNGCGKCGCGLIDNVGMRISPIHLRNCDNEYHNWAFINRK